jgi:hypothetical protein
MVGDAVGVERSCAGLWLGVEVAVSLLRDELGRFRPARAGSTSQPVAAGVVDEDGVVAGEDVVGLVVKAPGSARARSS